MRSPVRLESHPCNWFEVPLKKALLGLTPFASEHEIFMSGICVEGTSPVTDLPESASFTFRRGKQLDPLLEVVPLGIFEDFIKGAIDDVAILEKAPICRSPALRCRTIRSYVDVYVGTSP